MTVEDAPESFDPTIPATIEQRSEEEASGDGGILPHPAPVGCASFSLIANICCAGYRVIDSIAASRPWWQIAIHRCEARSLRT